MRHQLRHTFLRVSELLDFEKEKRTTRLKVRLQKHRFSRKEGDDELARIERLRTVPITHSRPVEKACRTASIRERDSYGVVSSPNRYAIMNKGQWSRFNIATISILVLIASCLPASALGNNRSEQTKDVANVQPVSCSDPELEALTRQWRESYLPAGGAIRSCGDLAIEPLIDVMADSTVEIRTRRLTARLIRQIGSEAAVQSLITALGDYQTQELAWASLKTMHEEPESRLLETISSILSETDMPSEVKAGAIRFAELYAAWEPQFTGRDTSVDMMDVLLMVITDEAEEADLRVWAAEALAKLVYERGGYGPAETVQPETLARVATTANDQAVRQSATNVLMMTYYITVTHRSCFYRQAEVDMLEQALLSIGDRNSTDDVQELAATSDEAKQTRVRAALSNVMDIVHPNGEDTCVASQGVAPGAYFIDHVKRSQQGRLLEQLVQWANTLG